MFDEHRMINSDYNNFRRNLSSLDYKMNTNFGGASGIEWTTKPQPIHEFIRNFKVPQVVRIHDSENKRFQVPGNFSLHQPILLYKVYTCRKIHGRALALDNGGNVKPAGPALIIPDSYPGWLAMVTKDGRTAGFFSSIGEVARADAPMFLVQDTVLGLKATTAGLCRTVVARGQVLKVVGSFEDLNRQNIVTASKGNVHPDFMMYLKCLTKNGEPIYLPYGARGRFYCIANPRSHSLNHVFLMSNLLRVAKLPVLIRIVSGTRPHIALPFTNVVQLEEMRQETIILGCTLVDNEPVLLEINANSAFSFVKALDDRILQRSEIFQRMCQLCTIEGDRWRQQIRVAHHVVPKPPIASTMSVKSYRVPRPPIPKSMSVRNYIPPPRVVNNNYCRSECSSYKTNKSCKDSRVVTPCGEIVDFSRNSYRGYIFPKKFWMFRKASKFELSNKKDKNGKPRADFINTVSYAKSQNRKFMTVKIVTGKGAELLIGGEKVRLEVQRFANSDDGYVTSYADEESIYHSIC